jgi:DNA invertase Pin-like site-specific DNA recombinase
MKHFSSISQPFLSNKIQRHHYDRLAMVYIRQSTLQQVERNTESTKLQYALADKAYQLGWSKDKIVIIDDDLGRSGSQAEGRPGFQRLVAEVGLDHVGIILGIEVSRLARSCRDWYQLLEICGLFSTLIGDADGIYDPVSYNDRLLLGLKGTMSEAELHVLKQRMQEGRLAKARRGELSVRLPSGYVEQPSGNIVKDPDEQVQITVGLIFDLFERFRSVGGVLKYLARHRIQIPHRERRRLQKGELVWSRPNRATLSYLFHNPIYAGAYVYGRYSANAAKRRSKEPSTGGVPELFPEGVILIKDQIPSYITWEQYERNVRQLAANCMHESGIPRQGSSLLSGLLYCGRCGARMVTYYGNGGDNSLRYCCGKSSGQYGEPACQSLVGKSLDEFVAQQALSALQPSALEISLKVAEEIEQERQQLLAQWEKRLERVCYESERAYRQYNATEPENRLVVRTLEKKWEEALAAEEKIKREYAQFLEDQPTRLSTDEQTAIRQLAADVPALWSAETTTARDRKEIIRLLIDRIVVTVEGRTEKVGVEIHWSGGHKIAGELNRSVGTFKQLSYYPQLLERATILYQAHHTFKAIAEQLNQEGWPTARKNICFTASSVRNLLGSGKIISSKKVHAAHIRRLPHEWTIRELSQETDIPESTLYHWMRQGLLEARRVQEVSHGGILLVKADPEGIQKLLSMKKGNKEWQYRFRVKKVQ